MPPVTAKTTLIKFSLLLLAALLLWLIFGQKGGRKADGERTEEGIVLVTELTPNNFFISEDGTFGGLQVELARLLLPDTVIRWLPADSRRSALRILISGEADVYASPVPLASEDRFPGTESTVPIYATSFALIYPKGTDWMADFSRSDGETVIYGSGDDPAAAQIVSNISDLSYPTLRYRSLPVSSQEVALKVFGGEIKYALIEKGLAEKIAGATGDSIAVSTDLAFSSNQVWLVKEGRDTLLTRLNHQIAAAKETNEYKDIIARHLGK